MRVRHLKKKYIYI